MPDNHDSDFSKLEFRNDEIRHFPRAIEDQGTPFWRMVGAVFVALCLFGALQALAGMLVYRAVMAEVEAMAQQWERETKAAQAEMQRVIGTRSTSSAQPAARSAAQQQPVALAMHGPVVAKARGHATACIGGRVANRLPDGWSQTRERCRALSE